MIGRRSAAKGGRSEGRRTGAEEAAVEGGLAEGAADGGDAEDGLDRRGFHAGCEMGVVDSSSSVLGLGGWLVAVRLCLSVGTEGSLLPINTAGKLNSLAAPTAASSVMELEQ